MSPRATPLPPDERRAALVAATLPLLRAFGRDVSTRMIAEAAGVAEGTIFRVFPNKEALIDAAVESAFDPAPLCAALESIDLSLPLEERMTLAVEAVQARLLNVIGLLIALRMHRPPDDDKSQPRRGHGSEGNQLILEAMAKLLAPDSEKLRYPPEEVARRIRLITFSATHPLISDHQPLSAAEIVDFVLDGVRNHDRGNSRC